MNIQFYNCPQPQKLTLDLKDKPNFLEYTPDFVAMQKIVDKYSGFKNIIVVGHGGSITSFMGVYFALQEQTTKEAYFVNTIDPDFISKVKEDTHPENTLVLAISKSGQTVTQLEALAQFLDYPLVVITGVAGPLADIAHVRKADVIIHPPIGGRYTGLTEVGLLPAMLCGLDVKEMYNAGAKLYGQYQEKNSIYESASILFQLEEQGIVDVFMPIYSNELRAFGNLIVQLCHESFGKDGKGQTYFAHIAPESQHHTNQRFFGGRKNVAGWFLSEEPTEIHMTTKFPDDLVNISIESHKLGDLNGISLNAALNYEREGTIEDAKLHSLPVIDMHLEQLTPTEIGRLIAFWQMYAVYSSLLRDVNPFDQPQVENSKKISFAKRLAHNGKM